MQRGRFITFEGGEGSGKSTQARRLAARLEAAGIAVTLTREPGGSPFAERLRSVILDPATPPHSPLSEALLFYAARADHVAHTIRPALAAGRWVVCDRFSDSTRVYQGAAGALSRATIEALEGIAVAPTVPDLTLVVDLDPAIGLARADRRRDSAEGGPRDRYEARTLAYHAALRQGFLAIAAENPARCVVIDGAGAEDVVAGQIWAAAERRLMARAG